MPRQMPTSLFGSPVHKDFDLQLVSPPRLLWCGVPDLGFRVQALLRFQCLRRSKIALKIQSSRARRAS